MVDFIGYRLEYSKLGAMKFIGHIDLMKLFHKLFRMSGLPTVFSQGFNPHQIFTIAHPLSLGMEGLAELADFRLSAPVGNSEIAEALNSLAPEGLRVGHVRTLAAGEKNCAALVAAADYKVYVGALTGLSGAIASILSRKEIVVGKRTKSGTSQTDIRKDIFALTAHEPDTLGMRVSAGSADNLKPQLVMSEIFRELGLIYDEHEFSCTRVQLLCRQGGGFERLG